MLKKELLFLTSLIVLCVFISSIDAKTKSIHYPGEDCDPRFPTAECRERCLKSDRCRGGTDSIPPLKQFLQKILKDSQSIASNLLAYGIPLASRKTVSFLDEKVNSVILGFIPTGRANHYMPSLKAGSIVKVDRFEVSRCSSMYKIIDHSFLIRFISPTIIDEVITGAPDINLQA
uniref:Uncharacterized protein n=1 Tax=Brassica oleracea TaxID=3712 RepID=A0A3P6DYE8_BRAOL|nr:unnamed protein product [Brassica oleracea]